MSLSHSKSIQVPAYLIAAEYSRHPSGICILVKVAALMYPEIAQAQLGTQLFFPEDVCAAGCIGRVQAKDLSS